MYSLIQSCVINDIIPREDFNHILPKLPAVRHGEIEAVPLLPQFLAPGQPQAGSGLWLDLALES